jgi:hypothetical protein
MFLRGTLTAADIQVTGQENYLLKLLAGEMADADGHIVPAEDAWTRDDTDKNILYSPGSHAGNPTNRNALCMRLKFKGAIYTNVTIAFAASFKFRDSSNKNGTWSNWSGEESSFGSGRLTFFWPYPVSPYYVYVDYYISVTKDRIIITLKGNTNAPYGESAGQARPMTTLLYMGTYESIVETDHVGSVIDYHPMVVAQTHASPNEWYFEGNGYGTAFATVVGAQKPSGTFTGGDYHWVGERTGGKACATKSLTPYYPETCYFNNTDGILSSTNTEQPNTWEQKWYMYPIYIRSSEWMTLGGYNNYYPVPPSLSKKGQRGKFLDLYALNYWRALHFGPSGDQNEEHPPGFTNLDTLEDFEGATSLGKYRLVSISGQGSYAGMSGPCGLGTAFYNPLAFKQV